MMCEWAKQTYYLIAILVVIVSTRKCSDRRTTMMITAKTVELIGQVITEHDTYNVACSAISTIIVMHSNMFTSCIN